MNNTIYALATPPGKSGVAIIRVSGERALEMAEALTGEKIAPRYAMFSPLKNGQGEILDEGIVLYFQSPSSFTGEDVVEFQIHGSPAGVHAISRELECLGAKLAEPGEFTKRALENGKLDILQVEALSDFINSDTEIQRKQSLNGYLGRDSAWVVNLKEKLLQTMSLVTLSIDFTDEELPDDLMAQIQSQIRALEEEISLEVKRSKRSASLRDGFRVAILGKPNAGKSTLLNEIAGREVAIATEIPGTTRDVIEVFVDLSGIPVVFLDTAGLRETDDVVEEIGVERALEAARQADLRLFLYEDEKDLESFSDMMGADDLAVRSKSDLNGEEGFSISAKTGEGVEVLLKRVKQYFSNIARELGRFQHQRQIEALENSEGALREAYSLSFEGEVNMELVAEYLRQAVFALDYLVGRVDVEDMLDVIFSRFCIGK